jgi:hypothetical protein
MERALVAGVPVHVLTVVGRNLLPRLPRFAEELFDGHPDIRDLTLIQMIRVRDDALDLSKEILTPEEFIAMVKMASLLNLWGLRVAVLRNPLATAVSRALSIPWLAPSAALHRGGGIMVMADGGIACAHSTEERFGEYRPGAVAAALGSAAYRAAVAADDAACASCRHLALCRENGMLRPSERNRDMDESSPFCVRVLDAACREEEAR